MVVLEVVSVAVVILVNGGSVVVVFPGGGKLVFVVLTKVGYEAIVLEIVFVMLPVPVPVEVSSGLEVMVSVVIEVEELYVMVIVNVELHDVEVVVAVLIDVVVSVTVCGVLDLMCQHATRFCTYTANQSNQRLINILAQASTGILTTTTSLSGIIGNGTVDCYSRR